MRARRAEHPMGVRSCRVPDIMSRAGPLHQQPQLGGAAATATQRGAVDPASPAALLSALWAPLLSALCALRAAACRASSSRAPRAA